MLMFADNFSREIKNRIEKLELPSSASMAICIAVFFLMLSLVSLIGVWAQVFPMASASALLWSILFVFDVLAHLADHRSLLKWHFLTGYTVMGVLWYAVMTIERSRNLYEYAPLIKSTSASEPRVYV